MCSSYKHMTTLHFDTDFLSQEFQLVCVSANDQLNTPGFHTYNLNVRDLYLTLYLVITTIGEGLCQLVEGKSL